jgi:hypothetical protein
MEASKKSELVRRVIGDGLNDMLRGNVGVERALRAMESEIALAIDYD